MSGILLINPNEMQPPVTPMGLEYIGTYLLENEEDAYLLDLSLIEESKRIDTLRELVEKLEPELIGLTVRNVDDCYTLSQDFILPKIKIFIDEIRKISSAPIVVGGVGFSIMPEDVMNYLDVDFGIVGDGERAMKRLCQAIRGEREFDSIPGLAIRKDGQFTLNPQEFPALENEPYPIRYFIDNKTYFNNGGMVGIETKRGCPLECIYCVDPVAKGREVRLRPVDYVIAEIKDLLNKGINVFHICDSEFNVPISHSREICEAIIDEELGEDIEWYAYVTPKGLDSEVLAEYKAAGCRGLDFGVDSMNDELLKTLGRNFSTGDTITAINACKELGIACMTDMLIGGPGETRETITRTIESIKKLSPDRIGLSVGIRIYPYTQLAEMIKEMSKEEKESSLFGEVEGNDNFLRPVFYIEQSLGWEVHKLLSELIGDDERFYFTDPHKVESNYNYNDNTVLIDAIKAGKKGAFWNILREIQNGQKD